MYDICKYLADKRLRVTCGYGIFVVLVKYKQTGPSFVNYNFILFSIFDLPLLLRYPLLNVTHTSRQTLCDRTG